MYKILIADDEALEREGLEWIIDHMLKENFRIIHAENGRRAIELAEEEHPHIVLMDVNMPGIRGLDAIREIKESLPDTKFVLVTAYDYFAYAKEALSLGVKEYIVKPAKRNEVVEILQQLVQELDEEKRRRQEHLELKNKVSQLVPLAENELALMIMVHQTGDSDAAQLAEWLDFPLGTGCSMVAALAESPTQLDEKRLYDFIRSYTKSSGMECILSSLIDQHIAIFLTAPRNPDQHAGWMDEVKRFGEDLCLRVERQVEWSTSISVGVGSLCEGADGLHQSYFEAVFASAYYEQGGKVCRFDDLRNGEGEAYKVSSLSDGQHRLHRSYVATALQRSREEREQETITVLDRARQYILQRYTEELSLEDVAEHVHLNPYYLSKIMKQQFGESFIDLLTRLRIEKAKEIMSSEQLSLKEVCFEVGYKDPNYFSRVFKRVTGMTPTEYRNQLR
ncbi:AraC family transcriptional regulator [Paenibacillus sp. JX-17]|uniref:AraC family transcriptional regulator n=1 Tax=Paenibacillus lacisoli TaxID=3064525 RepID=A0ABT9CFI3_9BACL|nr:AraC family transcriptional regulator [Paenibacillus sp. JX-17]MDO7908039.1 AraC family transcriptional regulator [Paenibacillus sp. JX-17]